jgi:hypothetical protein
MDVSEELKNKQNMDSTNKNLTADGYNTEQMVILKNFTQHQTLYASAHWYLFQELR